MPRGEYLLDDGSIESFTAAPGPMGWRCFATRGALRLDLSVDARGRPVRVRLEDEAHALLLVRRGDGYEGIHDGTEVTFGAPDAFAFPSPCFAAAALHARAAGGTLEVLAIDPATFEPRAVRIDVADGGEEAVTTPVGAFDARRWSWDGRAVWVGGIVAVAGDGFELRSYEPGATGPAPRLRPL